VSARGAYGGRHQATRRALLPDAYGRPCPRCGLPMLPGQALDLDHTDDRVGYLGCSHAKCNRAAGARLGNARRRQQRERSTRMVTEGAIALEISEDRQHTSIVAAGHLDEDLVLLELASYLSGTDPAAVVAELQRQPRPLAIVIDAHSNAATLLKPLEDAGFKITRPSSVDLVVAHGRLLDLLAEGRIRHRGQAELTSAVRHLEQRRLGGATAPERRGALVDVAPAVAAELAAWALLTVPRTPAPAIFSAATGKVCPVALRVVAVSWEPTIVTE
jgi:hypothetical protein